MNTASSTFSVAFMVKIAKADGEKTINGKRTELSAKRVLILKTGIPDAQWLKK